MKISLGRFAGLALALALFGSAAHAQGWPDKPVRMVINFPPGGPSDILTRMVDERLQAALGQPFVVENRPGASGNIGADVVAKAAPDGHIFGITPDTVYTVNPLVFRKMTFDPWDTVPVTLLGSFSQMMVCNPSVPVTTLADLVALAKKERLAYASGGAGVPGHLAAELLLSMTGATMTHVPYKGPAPATSDVMGGQVPCGFLATPTVLPHVKAGRLKALAVSTKERSALAPDVPTADQAGVRGFDAPFYLVLFAPKGTPAEIVSRMSEEVGKALADPKVRERAATLDVTPLGGTPQQALSTLKASARKWEPVVKRIGLKMD
ncbi:MAG TPA: tripartite tricarboxylate transporter substrate binding protein [Burkholderiales bacterium]|jgi:tripartite-type tricarboxylate transporter receptor subunit TctC